jgi:hypothetical protein
MDEELLALLDRCHAAKAEYDKATAKLNQLLVELLNLAASKAQPPAS